MLFEWPLSGWGYGLTNRLNPFNHCPHFPFFMTQFTDSMPISSIGGITPPPPPI